MTSVLTKPAAEKPVDHLGHCRRLDGERRSRLAHRHASVLVEQFQERVLPWIEPDAGQKFRRPNPIGPGRLEQLERNPLVHRGPRGE
jgi:hypothetical protein